MPTTPGAVYTSHNKTATELDIHLAPDYWLGLGWVHILHFFIIWHELHVDNNFAFIIILR